MKPMSFPIHELQTYRYRLSHALPTYTTRCTIEQGRYRIGQYVHSQLGILHILSITTYNHIHVHPFLSELSPKQITSITTPYNLIQLSHSNHVIPISLTLENIPIPNPCNIKKTALCQKIFQICVAGIFGVFGIGHRMSDPLNTAHLSRLNMKKILHIITRLKLRLELELGSEELGGCDWMVGVCQPDGRFPGGGGILKIGPLSYFGSWWIGKGPVLGLKILPSQIFRT